MFTVKECTDLLAARALCEKWGAPFADGDRVFVLDEDGPQAVGLLGLRKGKVLVKGVYGDVSPAYRELVRRSLLHVCSLMPPIPVRVDETDDAWEAYGFTAHDGGMEAMNTDIRYPHSHP